jgi:hypothetical protein
VATAPPRISTRPGLLAQFSLQLIDALNQCPYLASNTWREKGRQHPRLDCKPRIPDYDSCIYLDSTSNFTNRHWVKKIFRIPVISSLRMDIDLLSRQSLADKPLLSRLPWKNVAVKMLFRLDCMVKLGNSNQKKMEVSCKPHWGARSNSVSEACSHSHFECFRIFSRMGWILLKYWVVKFLKKTVFRCDPFATVIKLTTHLPWRLESPAQRPDVFLVCAMAFGSVHKVRSGWSNYPYVTLCLYVSMSLCLYVSICLYVFYASMSLCLYVSLSLCLYVSMFLCLYVSMSLCLYVLNASI